MLSKVKVSSPIPPSTFRLKASSSLTATVPAPAAARIYKLRYDNWGHEDPQNCGDAPAASAGTGGGAAAGDGGGGAAAAAAAAAGGRGTGSGSDFGTETDPAPPEPSAGHDAVVPGHMIRWRLTAESIAQAAEGAKRMRREAVGRTKQQQCQQQPSLKTAANANTQLQSSAQSKAKASSPLLGTDELRAVLQQAGRAFRYEGRGS